MKKAGALFLVLALAVGLTLPMVMPAAASDGSYTLYGIIGGKYLVTVDPSTGDATAVWTLSGPQDRVTAIAFDSTTNTLYGLARTGGTHRPFLATINICTGDVTVIGQITLTGETVYFAEGFAVDPSGTIYVSMSINGDFSPGSDYYSETLATVDPVTAEATVAATISNTVQTEADGLEFVGNTLYATDDPGSGPTRIYTIDTGSGVATLKGTLSSPRFNNVNDMAYNPDTMLLYGFDPGAYTNGHPRYLCIISQPGAATANPIGITHTAAEFDGGLMSGLAWASVTCLIEVDIDIKPGSDPNCFNNDGKGAIPVAILGSADFDITLIDPSTVSLEGLAIKMVGKANKLLAHIEDVNGDGYDDLVVQIQDEDGVFTAGSSTATITGNLYDGTPFEGTDSICVVPE